MKTALIVTAHLDEPERFEKTVKFINHYRKLCPHWDIIVFDNASNQGLIESIKLTSKIKLHRFNEHFGRPSHLDYKYLWRAVYHLQHILMSYDKVVYMDNDFFVLSQKMVNYIDDLSNGWTTFWCPLFNFPETGCHIVVAGCKEYHDFVSGTEEAFIAKWNNTGHMEVQLPVTHVERNMDGDRFGEYVLHGKTHKPSPLGKDFWAQADIEDTFD